MIYKKLILYLLFVISFAQPKVEILYPKSLDTVLLHATMIVEGGDTSYYANIKFLSQPLNPLVEIGRVRITDTLADSIYNLPLRFGLITGSIIDTILLCDTTDTPYFCPCNPVISLNKNPIYHYYVYSGYIDSPHLIYSLTDCIWDTVLLSCDTLIFPSDTSIICESLKTYDEPYCDLSTNVHLVNISSGIWDLYFGAYYMDTFFLFPRDGYGCLNFVVSPFCNDSGLCSEPVIDSSLYLFQWSRAPRYKLDYFPSTDSILRDGLTSRISVDIALFGESAYKFYLALDSTSAWFIIRFETITGDTFTDTVRYGDPGTFWIVPPGKHIGWRRFGVMTMYTDIPSRGYTGVVEVCLMDVTNAPVIAFGEPTHLHPEGVSCYEDWVYVDSVTGDTTVIPDIIPAPPEPVCWRFGLISEVSEAERGEDKLNLEVVGGYLSPIQVFYRISGVGHLELYDITGKVVLRRAISAKGSEKIGIDKLNSGVYFIRVVSGERSVVRKVLVVR